jgi:hypothetical protein
VKKKVSEIQRKFASKGQCLLDLRKILWVEGLGKFSPVTRKAIKVRVAWRAWKKFEVEKQV